MQTEKFATITQNLIMRGHIARAKKILAITEKLVETGSQEAKQIILSIFSNTLIHFSNDHAFGIKNLVPTKLRTFISNP